MNRVKRSKQQSVSFLQAAKILGIHSSTLYSALRRGEIPVVFEGPDGEWRIHKKDLQYIKVDPESKRGKIEYNFPVQKGPRKKVVKLKKKVPAKKKAIKFNEKVTEVVNEGAPETDPQQVHPKEEVSDLTKMVTMLVQVPYKDFEELKNSSMRDQREEILLEIREIFVKSTEDLKKEVRDFVEKILHSSPGWRDIFVDRVLERFQERFQGKFSR